MRAIFIGEDRSLELTKGRSYTITASAMPVNGMPYPIVIDISTTTSNNTFLKKVCPYQTLESFFNDWKCIYDT